MLAYHQGHGEAFEALEASLTEDNEASIKTDDILSLIGTCCRGSYMNFLT